MGTMHMPVGKPDTLTFKWLSGLLITIVLGLLGFWARDVSGQIREVGEKVDIQNEVILNIKGQLPSITDRLKRIEDNQDADLMMYRRRR